MILIRYCFLILLGACVLNKPGPTFTPFVESDVRYSNGGVELGAALLMPQGRGPFPGAVILQGSGDSDRSNTWSRQWAEALASRGIATLLTDKRGTGKSTGEWRAVGFEELARDGIAGVEFLQSQRGVRKSKVGVVGLSQGGQVAPLAGALSPNVAFVADISGSATGPVAQVDHEMRNTFREAGLDEEGVAAGMRLQELAGRYIMTGDWDSYHAALQQALASPLKPVAQGFPQTRDFWLWEWWRKIKDYDPIDSWKRLDVPGLVVYGELDERDNVPVAASVARLAPLKLDHDLSVHVIPETGHALFDHSRSDHALRADVVDLIVKWIHAHEVKGR